MLNYYPSMQLVPLGVNTQSDQLLCYWWRHVFF